MPCTNPVRCKVVRGTSTSDELRCPFPCARLCHWGWGCYCSDELNASWSGLSLIRSPSSGDQVAVLTHQRQGECSDLNGKHRQSNVHNGLWWSAQVRWILQRRDPYRPFVLANQPWRFSRHEVDKKLTAFLFFFFFLKQLYKWIKTLLTNQRLHWIMGQGESGSVNWFPHLSQFADPGDHGWRKDLDKMPKNVT